MPLSKTPSSRFRSMVCASAIAVASQAALGQFTTFSPVATNAYSAGDINSVSFQASNLTTVDGHQFVAYYDTSRRVVIGRRAVGSSTWQTFLSGYSITSSEVTDSHNVIGIAVDSGGYMHLSWNHHNVGLNYAISNTTVTGATLGSLGFTRQTAANAPTLFPGGGATTNAVTYPQFYAIPGSGDLLFTYRNGGAGGGSGNGNQYFNVYSPSTRTWTNRLVINGEQTSVNGYVNSLAFTSDNDLMMSWTWRGTPAWQTNSNILFAESPDVGSSWYRLGGTSQYTLPIIQSGSPANAVGQVVKAIPQGSSLINQTSMTVDGDDNPMIATWWAPGWNAATNSGDPNRQYMLVYHDGGQWRTSQVTNRTGDASVDTSAWAVRDLGRPVVLTDREGRVLVVTRSHDSGMGAYSNPATSDNEIVVYYNTVESLRSASPMPWRSVALDTANMGSWEPTYDRNLWESQNRLALYWQPMGVSGQTSGTVGVLEWDAQGYFTNLTKNSWALAAGGDWDGAGSWGGAAPNGAGAVANFGTGLTAPSAHSVVTVSGNKVVGSMTFDSPAYRYSLVPGAGGGSLTLNSGAAGTAATVSVSSGAHAIAVPVTLAAGGVNVSVPAVVGAVLTISGNVTGSGGLTKTGGGTLVLSGNNTYSGPTAVTGGALRAVGAGAVSPNSSLSLNGGMLEASGSLTRSAGTGAGQVQVIGGSSGFAAHGGDLTVTIPGGVTWGSASFGPGVLVVNGAGSTGNVTLAADINLNGAGRTVQVNAGVNTFGGVISSGAGSLNVNGAGTLVLAKGNTYGGGTTMNSVGQGPATVRAAADNALGTGAVTTGPQGNGTTARLELVGGITLPNAIAMTGRTNASAAIRNVGGENVLAGTVSLSMGGNYYWIESDGGKLTLAGGVTAAGGVTGARNLTLRGAGDGAVTGRVQNNGAVVAIAKEGSGTWTLAGANTYTGVTTVAAGELVLGKDAWGPVLTGAGGADVKGGRLVFDYAGGGSPAGTVVPLLAESDGSTSSGTYRIRSSTSDSNRGLGWADDTVGRRLTVAYTYRGDLNLDGSVTVDDLISLDRGFALGLTGWANGDVDYDGAVTVDDYLIVDRIYASQGAPLSVEFLAAREARFGEGYVAELVAAVPEPASAGVMAMAGCLLLSRRRTDRRTHVKACEQGLAGRFSKLETNGRNSGKYLRKSALGGCGQ